MDLLFVVLNVGTVAAQTGMTQSPVADGMPLICDDPSDADHLQNGQPCVQPESCNQGDPRLVCISDERAVPRGTVNAAPAQGETDVGGPMYMHNRGRSRR